MSVHLKLAKGKLVPIDEALRAQEGSRAALAEWTRLGRIFPALGRAGVRARGQLALSQDEAWDFLTMVGPTLVATGFDVRAPQISRRKATPSLRLFAESSAESVVGAHQHAPRILRHRRHRVDRAWRLDFLVQQIQPRGELVVDGFTSLRPFNKNGQVFCLLPERHDEGTVLFEAPAALQHFLRFCLVLPELWRGGACFEAGQFFVGSRNVKDSSADHQRAY